MLLLPRGSRQRGRPPPRRGSGLFRPRLLSNHRFGVSQLVWQCYLGRIWSGWPGSNRRPPGPKPGALPLRHTPIRLDDKSWRPRLQERPGHDVTRTHRVDGLTGGADFMVTHHGGADTPGDARRGRGQDQFRAEGRVRRQESKRLLHRRPGPGASPRPTTPRPSTSPTRPPE